jgi:hypothetical protein
LRRVFFNLLFTERFKACVDADKLVEYPYACNRSSGRQSFFKERFELFDARPVVAHFSA